MLNIFSIIFYNPWNNRRFSLTLHRNSDQPPFKMKGFDPLQTVKSPRSSMDRISDSGSDD